MSHAQSDDVIWSLIGHGFCSFKLSSPSIKTHQTFCRNAYNLTGWCNRQSCPLANARYATVRDVEGTVYLYIKTPERAHAPSKLWERVKLSNNIEKAMKQIDEELPFWNNFVIHKAKQRWMKIKQYRDKMRSLAKVADEQPKLVGIKKKTERREANRENKAMRAARLEKSIEAELLSRLKSGLYGEAPLNVNEDIWRRVIEEKAEKEGLQIEREEELLDEQDEEDEWDMDSEDELEEEEDFDGVGDREFVEDEDSDDELDDLEEIDEEEEDDEDAESGASSEDLESDLSDSASESADTAADPKAGRKRPASDVPPKKTLDKRVKAAPPRARLPKKPAPKKGKKGSGGAPNLEVEYEQETVPLSKESIANW
ncbi:Mak16 protein [Ceraceosorus guamensis]|uniref:Protein MAK16 n=1 Tax=Ceraceosorus guamensis TaxID=1522189 RepID=A0A316W3T9_9BASI|nr:Mak16 protein [Ceraceosorus guamensis]PWN42255.1 Mak16 protein [Ceraceosorus guamensis]